MAVASVRQEYFSVDESLRVLERHVRPRGGRPYCHRVSFADVEKLAYGIGELSERLGKFTMWDLARHEFGSNDGQSTPALTTRAATVLAFAREEAGLVFKDGRGNRAVNGYDPLLLMVDVTGFNHRKEPSGGVSRG